MNEAMVYADDFKKSFRAESDFLDFLKNREEETSWKTEEANSLRFEAIEEGSKRLEELSESYSEAGKEDVIKDTLENTKLMLRTGTESIPVRSCAIKTVLERAKISGTALSKVERSVFASILNHCMNVATGKALLKISDDKVSAVHGGDESDYAVLEMHELFNRTHDFLNDNYSKVTYAGGFFEHSMVTALWTLDESEELVEVYKDMLDENGIRYKEILPSLRLTSSDVGMSGANLYPTLLVDGKNIPLGSPLKLEHKHGASLSDFDEKLDMVYSQYDMALGKLKNLIGIIIKYPVNTMIGVMKKIGIPKKLAMGVVEKFEAVHGVGFCSAHDIYYAIADVIYELQCSGESGIKVTQMEETVSRALNVRWHDYDIPGIVSW
ncbi:MAG: transposase [Clostridia bacterium]|nr:transposase [Clostridia bacterium]